MTVPDWVVYPIAPHPVQGYGWRMTDNIHIILPVLALILAVVGIIRPQYPLVACAVLLLAVNALVR
jgi:hypothetical protein